MSEVQLGAAKSTAAPAMTRQQQHFSASGQSALAIYRELAVGSVSWRSLLRYELSMLLLSNLAGALGLGARTALYPGLFRQCGKRPAFGRGMVIRRPAQITLGDKVLLDDYTSLDVRGANGEIAVGDHAILSRFSTIAAKNGRVVLGPGVNIGSYCRIATESSVQFGSSVLVGAFCYIGPGNHQLGTDGTPLIAMEMEQKGGVTIGNNAWLGTHVTVVDGVSIGEGAIVGAHALVREDVPPWTVVAGTPAKIIKQIPRNS